MINSKPQLYLRAMPPHPPHTPHPPPTPLSYPQELYNMKKYAPQLVVLDLRDNPICTDKAYRSTTLRKLKHLEK